MDENRMEGTARRVVGRVEDAIGGLAGDLPTQARGKARAAAGEVQEMYGAAIDSLESYVKEKPVMALGLVAGIAFLIGFIFARR